MKFIKRVKIDNFRSIRSAEFPDLNDYTVLVGRNSSGKSNILRALNLFFNNETDPGKLVSFERDYHAVPRSKSKKLVRIAIDFVLPPSFQFPQKIFASGRKLGSEFRITKEWTLDAALRPTVNTWLQVGGKHIEPKPGEDFLNLLLFRYIPNRTVPADVLREESQVLGRAILKQLRTEAVVRKTVDSLSTASGKLLEEAALKLKASGAPLSDPAIAAGFEPGELLALSGFKAQTATGAEVDSESWGAGHQSFFLYHVLKAADLRYNRSFGWRQGTIWVVEEPESGLHRDLETLLASSFADWSTEEQPRLQLIVTTHSPVFTMAAGAGSFVDLNDDGTLLRPKPIPELVRESQVRGITQWIQPLLGYPNDVLVLVEGNTDAKVFAHVFELGGGSGVRFLDLPNLDPAVPRGGDDAILTYLRRQGALINNRLQEAPLLVLLDWEIDNNKLNQIRIAYGSNGQERVHRMDSVHCAFEMGPDFKGIERFYPPAIIREINETGAFSMAVSEGEPFSISTSQLNRAKTPLKERVLKASSLSEVPQLNAALHQFLSDAPGYSAI